MLLNQFKDSSTMKKAKLSIREKRKIKREKKKNRVQQKIKKAETAKKEKQRQKEEKTIATEPSSSDLGARLKKLRQMYKDGILFKVEFEKAKNKLLK